MNYLKRHYKSYTGNLADNLPVTVPQQALYFFFEPHGQALFLETFCSNKAMQTHTKNQTKDRGYKYFRICQQFLAHDKTFSTGCGFLLQFDSASLPDNGSSDVVSSTINLC